MNDIAKDKTVNLRDSVVTVWRIRVPPDSEKQGKLGPDAGAPRETLYLRMRKRGTPADGLRSPQHFSNRIRQTTSRKT